MITGVTDCRSESVSKLERIRAILWDGGGVRDIVRESVCVRVYIREYV